MNNLLLTLAMAALGQLAPFAGGPAPMPGYGFGPGLPGGGYPGGGFSGGGLPPGISIAPGPGGFVGPGVPIAPGGFGGSGRRGYGGGMGGGQVVIVPGRMPSGGYGGRSYGRDGQSPRGVAPIPPAARTPQQQQGSEAEAFGLAPYR